ncbi:MurR/RpiR family transcriptional regulator [Parafannyhessea umbonata]|nr:MurR/RpiR family transcriptional regulator [Parafannyhessea umbonata]
MAEVPLMTIRDNMESFTRGEQKIAQYFLDNPNSILEENSITDLAQSMGSSNTSIIRFCQKLGYQGFSEFRFALRRELLQRGADSEPAEQAEGKDAWPEAERLLDVYRRYIGLIPQFVKRDQVDELARYIQAARRIVIWGVNRTALSAQQLSYRLSRIGYFSKMTSDYVVMSDDAKILEENDLCIVFSMNGRGNNMGISRSGSYSANMEAAHARGAHVVLITMNKDLGLRKHADLSIVLPWISHENKSNFFEDQIVVYAFIELLLLQFSAD